MSNDEVYLDCAASAPVTDEVLQFLTQQYKKKLGNSSSIHRAGVQATVELEKARQKIANIIHCQPDEIYFTSGATESNNLALKGLLNNQLQTNDEIIISNFEHSSILQVALSLAKQGIVIKKAPVNSEGLILIDQLEKLMTDRTKLVSIVHANSEIGVIQNLAEIGWLCQKRNIIFHSDGAQAFCKTSIDVQKMNLDMYSISGHKIHAPKGVGAIYIRNGLQVYPQLEGGGHESGMRSGTVAVETITRLAYAADLYSAEKIQKLKSLQNFLVQELKDNFPSLRIHGSLEFRICSQLNFAIPGLNGKTLLKALDAEGIRVSVGSACQSGKKSASATLKAIGLTDDQAFEALRVSWGLESTENDIIKLIQCLKKANESNS